MLLYPRLPRVVAETLAGEYSSMSVGELAQVSALAHPAATYAPTGGHRVDPARLAAIQQRIRETAATCGYPESRDSAGASRFDAESGKAVYELMALSPSEASHEALWAFIACILLPDVVRWRFPGGAAGTTPERFLGNSRGLRNTFGRTWWRAYILHIPNQSEPYRYLELLGEDELVQITERPGLAGNPEVARQTCQSFLETARHTPSVSRSDLLRDSMKRLRRLLPLVSFETLDSTALQDMVDDVFRRSAAQLLDARRATENRAG